jgi:hypothetical protein
MASQDGRGEDVVGGEDARLPDELLLARGGDQVSAGRFR